MFVNIYTNFVLSVMLVIVRGNIYGMCTADDDCSARSICKPNGCKGYNCVCPQGMLADDTLTTCLIASKIGEFCDNTTRCLSRMAVCSDGNCTCDDFFRTTETGTCTFRDLRVVDENCTRSAQCADPYSVCSNEVCVCASGYRTKTLDEMWADPLSREQCVPKNSSLEYCGFERLPVIMVMSHVLVTPSSDVIETEGLHTSIETSPLSGLTPDLNTHGIEVPGYATLLSDISLTPDLNTHGIQIAEEMFSLSETIKTSGVFLSQSAEIIPADVSMQTSEVSASLTGQRETSNSNKMEDLSMQISDIEFMTIGYTVDESKHQFSESTPVLSEMVEYSLKTSSLDSLASAPVSLMSKLYLEIQLSESDWSRENFHAETRGMSEFDDVYLTIYTSQRFTSNVDTSTHNVYSERVTSVYLSSSYSIVTNNGGSNTPSDVITAEDVRVIIALLGATVSILLLLSITLILLRIIRGTQNIGRSNSVSPEPEVKTSTVPSVKRQRSLFKDRW